MARAASHKARVARKEIVECEAKFFATLFPWMSAVDWNALTGLGSQAFRASRDCRVSIEIANWGGSSLPRRGDMSAL